MWALLAVVLDLVFQHHVPHFHHRAQVGLDFRIYWAAGGLVNHGHDPYQKITAGLGFVYPPFALLPFQILAAVSRTSAFLLWLAVDAAIVAGLLVLALRRGMRLVWLVPVAAVVGYNGYTLRCVELGQIGLLLLGLIVVDVIGMAGRRGAGLLTGIAIGIKFTPGVFVLYFLARKQWRAAICCVAGFVLTVLVGLCTAPHASTAYWSQLLIHHKLGAGVPSEYGNANNQSLTNAVVMLTGPIGLGKVLGLVTCVAGLVAGMLAARQQRPWLAVALLGSASCLATGSTWDHHYVWMLAGVIAVACGELRGVRVSAGVLAVWTVWAFNPHTWHMLSYTPRKDFTWWQVIEAVATPVLAAVFVVTALLELRAAAHHRTPLDPAATTR